jgi:hypothetical protein
VDQSVENLKSGDEVVRVVNALWYANESLVDDADPSAAQRRWRLARFRYEAMKRLLLSCCPGCLANSLDERSQDEPPRLSGLKLLWDQATDARLTWYRMVSNIDLDPGITLDSNAEEAAARSLLAADDRPFLAAEQIGLVRDDFVAGGEVTRCRHHNKRPQIGQLAQAADEESLMVSSMARTMLLPRYMLHDYSTLVAGHRWVVWVVAYAVAAVVAGIVWAAWLWNSEPGAVSNLATTIPPAALGLAAINFGQQKRLRRSDAFDPWCLRIPASTMVGAAAVLGFSSSWALDPGHNVVDLLPAVIAPLVAVYLYMVLEASAAGTKGLVAWRRAWSVLLLAVGHAVLTTGVVLGTVGNLILAAEEVRPPIVEDLTSELDWFLDGAAPEIRVLAFLALTSTSLAVGVFLQILWEPSALTQPLARSRRRNDLD